MAAENKFCTNCGTPLVIQDGKYKCPNCGTEYAVDWGQEDVARAEKETEQERNQAQLDRDLALSQTRAQIARQEQYNQQQRQMRRAIMPFEKMLLRMGILMGGLLLIFLIIRVGSFLLLRNSGNLGILKTKDKTQTTESNQIVSGRIDKTKIQKDEDFLENAYAAEEYAVKYLVKQEAKRRDPERLLAYNKEYEYIESYLVYRDGRTELMSVFLLTFVSEDESETLKLFVPIEILIRGVDADGNVYSDYDPSVYYGYLGLYGGFENKDDLISEYLSYGDSVESTPFVFPEDVLDKMSSD